jgi:hypothetical protein
MHYYNVCPPSADENLVAAWDSQLRQLKTSWIEQLIAERGQDLFQRFASSYAELKALPRGARRAVQRRLAQPDNVGEVSSEWRRRLACTVAGAALLVALGQTAEAGGVKVSTIKLGTKCTLPNAISAANYAELIQQPFNKKTAYNYGFYYHGCKAAPGPNIIALPPAANFSFNAYNALPAIIGQITIQGAAAKKPKKGQPPPPLGNGGTLSGSGYALFFVGSGGSLSLQNVTLHGSYDGDGAVISNNGGTVTIVDSVISGSNAGRGGAIFNSGTLTITHSSITGNTADIYGGAIYNSGTLAVNTSTISGNTAGYSGGGIYNAYSATITNSTISGNTATTKNGGGIANKDGGALSIVSSTMTNSTAFKGGAVHNGADLTVTTSMISDSTAKYGGGIFNDNGGNVTLTGSTASGNTAELTSVTYYGGKGGGIYNYGVINLYASSISGNAADGKTVPLYDVDGNPTGSANYGGKGGGVYNKGDLNVYAGSAITSNTAAFFGGGLYNHTAGTYSAVVNTITGNGTPPIDPNGPDIYPPPP